MTDRPNPYQRGTAAWLVVEHRQLTEDVETLTRRIFTLKALLREARAQIDFANGADELNGRGRDGAAEGLVMRIDSTLETGP